MGSKPIKAPRNNLRGMGVGVINYPQRESAKLEDCVSAAHRYIVVIDSGMRWESDAGVLGPRVDALLDLVMLEGDCVSSEVLEECVKFSF